MHESDEPTRRRPLIERDSPGFQGAVQAISGRWTFQILSALFEGTLQFAELRRALPGITESMLITRLHHLEAAGLVRRVALTEGHRLVGYQITDASVTLAPIAEALTQWWLHHRPVLAPSDEPAPA